MPEKIAVRRVKKPSNADSDVIAAAVTASCEAGGRWVCAEKTASRNAQRNIALNISWADRHRAVST